MKESKSLKKNLHKIMLVKSSTGYLNSLLEVLINNLTNLFYKKVLGDPTVLEQLKDTKACEEIKILDKFFFVMKGEAG